MDSAGQLTGDLARELGGYYVEYRGERHPVLFAGDDWLAVAAPAEDRDRFPDALEFGSNSRGTWVKLPLASLDRRFRRRVDATWEGEPVTVVGPVLDGTVLLHYRRSPKRAAELGMQGDRNDYWQIRVPMDEVVVRDVVDQDLDG